MQSTLNPHSSPHEVSTFHGVKDDENSVRVCDLVAFWRLSVLSRGCYDGGIFSGKATYITLRKSEWLHSKRFKRISAASCSLFAEKPVEIRVEIRETGRTTKKRLVAREHKVRCVRWF